MRTQVSNLNRYIYCDNCGQQFLRNEILQKHRDLKHPQNLNKE